MVRTAGLRSRGVLAFGLLCAWSACKQDGVTQPCMNMAGQSQLVTQAAVLRVDIYDGAVSCAASSTATPLTSAQFAQGEAIELSLAAGSRTIVLTAYRDDAATIAIGRACTTATLGKGSNLCFDLTVEAIGDPDLPLPDLGGDDLPVFDAATDLDLAREPDLPIDDLSLATDLPELDLVPPADLKPECTESSVGSDCPVNQLCCNNKCTPINTATNCGACGSVCGTANTSDSSCATGSCVLVCNTGFADCDTAKANGCEVNLNEDPNHCGSCMRACSTTETNALDCTNGLCESTCTANHQNCAKPNAASPDDGCECEGNACCAGSCQRKHENGTGQTYYDCTNSDTTSGSQAMTACVQYAGAGGNCSYRKCNNDDQDLLVCNLAKNGPFGCCCWWHSGDGPQTGYPGKVYCAETAGGDCLCAEPGPRVWY